MRKFGASDEPRSRLKNTHRSRAHNALMWRPKIQCHLWYCKQLQSHRYAGRDLWNLRIVNSQCIDWQIFLNKRPNQVWITGAALIASPAIRWWNGSDLKTAGERSDFQEGIVFSRICDFMFEITLRNVSAKRHSRICYSFRNAVLSREN